MKKSILFVITILFITFVLVIIAYNNLKKQNAEIAKFNLEYEEYKDKEINGLDVVTLINKAVSNNEKNGINKNNNNEYILDDEFSIEIYVTMTNGDEKPTFPMERFVSTGLSDFIKYFGDVKFKCTNIEYHNKTNRVSTMTFEAEDY